MNDFPGMITGATKFKCPSKLSNSRIVHFFFSIKLEIVSRIRLSLADRSLASKRSVFSIIAALCLSILSMSWDQLFYM